MQQAASTSAHLERDVVVASLDALGNHAQINGLLDDLIVVRHLRRQ